MLVALAIVGYLSKDALKRYGLLGGAPVAAAKKAATPGERARSPGAVGAEALDVGGAPVAPADALERARGVEDMVRKSAEERAQRVERGTP